MKKIVMSLLAIMIASGNAYCQNAAVDANKNSATDSRVNPQGPQNHESKSIDELVQLLAPVLRLVDKESESTPVDVKVWSPRDLKQALLTEFNPDEIETILTFYNEMGGAEYIQKSISMTEKMVDFTAVQSSPIEKVDINDEWMSMIKKDLEVSGIKDLLFSMYQITNYENLSEKDMEMFASRLESYAAKLITNAVSFEEYKKDHEFNHSDLGARLRRLFEKSVQSLDS